MDALSSMITITQKCAYLAAILVGYGLHLYITNLHVNLYYINVNHIIGILFHVNVINTKIILTGFFFLLLRSH